MFQKEGACTVTLESGDRKPSPSWSCQSSDQSKLSALGRSSSHRRGTEALASAQPTESQDPVAWGMGGRLRAREVCVGHSQAWESVFPYLSLIQRAGGRSEECVCVCGLCTACAHMCICRGEGKLRCRGGVSPRRGVEEGHPQISRESSCARLRQRLSKQYS